MYNQERDNIKRLLVLRLNMTSNPALVDYGNVKAWQRLVTDYSLELFDDGTISSTSQLQFRFAHDESELIAALQYAEKYKYSVMLTSHGEGNSDTEVYVFGQRGDSQSLITKWNTESHTSLLKKDTPWYHCNETDGVRKPDQIFNDEAKFDIWNFFLR